MEAKAAVLVPPSRPTPYDVIPLTCGSVMAGLNTMVSSHVLIFRPGPEAAGTGRATVADVIKTGLADVLVPYYPLAGRIVATETGWEVRCDGRGAVFVVTSHPPPPPPHLEEEYLEKPVSLPVYYAQSERVGPEVKVHQPPTDVKINVVEDDFPPPPRHPHPQMQPSTPALMVQITELASGGFIMAIRVCRGVCDEAGLIHFLSGWAEMARGQSQVSVLPVWNRPPQHGLPNGHMDKFLHVHLPSLDNHQHTQTPYGHQPMLPANGRDMSLIHVHEYDNFVSCPHHPDAHRPANAAKQGLFRVDLPLEIVASLIEWLRVKEGCECTAQQALAAHVWRERTRALHVPYNVDSRLFFISGGDQRNVPVGYYGSFTFNCEAIANTSDLLEMPLAWAIQRIKEAESRLVEDFTTCTNDFKMLHCPCGYAPPEVLLFTNLPTNHTLDQLDFGKVGKLEPPHELIQFPTQVNIAALSRGPQASLLHLIMNNIPFVYRDELHSYIFNIPHHTKQESRM